MTTRRRLAAAACCWIPLATGLADVSFLAASALLAAASLSLALPSRHNRSV